MHDDPKIIYSIGHSTHSMAQLLAMLQSFGIKLLLDIRGLPGSRKFPQFDKENLAVVLPENGIQYRHMVELGGRRRPQKNSPNTRWRNEAFRGYADYMETEAFRHAMIVLEDISRQQPTAYMCAEVLWWRCHRSMISDYLKAKGWTVLHIMAVGKAEEHRYTSAARVVNGTVFYTEPDNSNG